MNPNRVHKMYMDAFKKYSDWTIETSIHKSREDAITCSLLGIVGEVNEYTDSLQHSEQEDFAKELGDIAYYIGHLVYRLGCVDKIERKPDIQMFPSEYVAKLCEAFKKVIRDDNYEIVGSRKEQEVYDQISNLLTWLMEEADDVLDEMDFLDVLSLNKDKLSSRKERGVIKGDGDNR